MQKVYKIVLLEDGKLKTLFKGINHSRILSCNIWLEAEKKMGIDGPNQIPYLTGIHCFKDKQMAEKYLGHFRTKKNRIIVTCFAEGLRSKPTNADVFLANKILIPKITF